MQGPLVQAIDAKVGGPPPPGSLNERPYSPTVQVDIPLALRGMVRAMSPERTRGENWPADGLNSCPPWVDI